MALVLHSVLVTVLIRLGGVDGHGMMIVPAARNTMWRFGYENPDNFNDNELYCGGYSRQWIKNDGKCGVCGDPFDGTRLHEAGGRFANGIIAGTYRQGETIDVTSFLTANHQGYFEYRLCPVNNYMVKATQDCFDRNLLATPSGKTRHYITGYNPINVTTTLVLPPDVTCSQCVLQWLNNAGNSWGCSDAGCCVGCGHQEQWYNCADISIGAGEGIPKPWSPWQPPTARPTESPQAWSPWKPQITRAPETPKPWNPWQPPTARPTESPQAWSPWKPQNTRAPETPRPWQPPPTRRPWVPPTQKPTTKFPTKQIPDWLNEVDEQFGQCRSKANPNNNQYNLWCIKMCFQGICPEKLCNRDCRETFKDKLRYT